MEQREETIIEDTKKVEDPQIRQLKDEAIKLINESDGLILFVFNKEQKDYNGSQIIIPATAIKTDAGCVAGGAISIPFAKVKINLIAKQVAEQEELKQAQMAM